MKYFPLVIVGLSLWLGTCRGSRAADPAPDPLAVQLQNLAMRRVAPPDGASLAEQLTAEVRQRLREASAASTQAWRQVESLADWQRLRAARLDKLREALHYTPQPGPPVRLITTKSQTGEGFVVDNVLFESRPGLWVSANLYRPADPPRAAPGFVICHSHHTPKTHGELQDMGMTWARLGGYVLIADQIGHGERREHPFRSEQDYAAPYRVSRQDYYFRYDLGVQAQLAGETLIGQIARDLSRAVDVLLTLPGIDRQRIALLGSVAGGGDPAAVAGALDERFSVVVPFNFGGPYVSTRSPLPEDIEESGNFVGSGSWESTRNLRDSAAQGFLPWVIVGAVAPRRLIYAHEFAWDRQRDPIWRRLQRIYQLYGCPDNLAFTLGRGSVQGQPPESTHCTHIGLEHRKLMHPAFDRWLAIPDATSREYSQRLPSESLLAWTPQQVAELKPRTYRDLLLAKVRAQEPVTRRDSPDFPGERLYRDVADQLARTAKAEAPILTLEDSTAPPVRRLEHTDAAGKAATTDVHAWRLQSRPPARGPQVAVLLFVPTAPARPPLVIGVWSAGKERFLQERSSTIAALLRRGVAVCLPDLRGTGESSVGQERDRTSAATAVSSSELMLGTPRLGEQLVELVSLVSVLRESGRVDDTRIGVWGDSFAPPNPPTTDFRIPHGVNGRPREAEPAGALLATLLPDQRFFGTSKLRAVFAQGGVVDFRDVLTSPWVLVPHDVLVPDLSWQFQLPALAVDRAPLPLRLVGFVDALNRPVADDELRRVLQPVVEQYRRQRAENQLRIGGGTPAEIADWFAQALN